MDDNIVGKVAQGITPPCLSYVVIRYHSIYDGRDKRREECLPRFSNFDRGGCSTFHGTSDTDGVATLLVSLVQVVR